MLCPLLKLLESLWGTYFMDNLTVLQQSAESEYFVGVAGYRDGKLLMYSLVGVQQL